MMTSEGRRCFDASEHVRVRAAWPTASGSSAESSAEPLSRNVNFRRFFLLLHCALFESAKLVRTVLGPDRRKTNAMVCNGDLRDLD